MSQEITGINAPSTKQKRSGVLWKAFAVLLVGSLLAGLLTDNRYVLGAAILLVGVGGFLVTFRGNDALFRREMANTAGPGWWIGWLISKAPGASARVLSFVLSLGITALGVAALLEL